MTQYSVFRNPEGAGFLLDVQSDLLDEFNTRVVVPLLPQGAAPSAANRLNPVFDIGGEAHVMMTQYLAAIPAGMLTAPVGNLSQRSDSVTGALDMLFHGF